MSAERKTAGAAPTAQAQSKRIQPSALFSTVRRSGLLGLLVLLCILAAVISPTFLQVANLINVLRQIALYGIVSIGMTFVILTAGIDLSVGSTVGIVAIAITQILNGTLLPSRVALGIGVIVGGLVGAVNGLGIAHGRIPPFIMTLGVMVMGRGLAMTLANGEPILLSDSAAAAVGWVGSGSFCGQSEPTLSSGSKMGADRSGLSLIDRLRWPAYVALPYGSRRAAGKISILCFALIILLTVLLLVCDQGQWPFFTRCRSGQDPAEFV